MSDVQYDVITEKNEKLPDGRVILLTTEKNDISSSGICGKKTPIWPTFKKWHAYVEKVAHRNCRQAAQGKPVFRCFQTSHVSVRDYVSVSLRAQIERSSDPDDKLDLCSFASQKKEAESLKKWIFCIKNETMKTIAHLHSSSEHFVAGEHHCV